MKKEYTAFTHSTPIETFLIQVGEIEEKGRLCEVIRVKRTIHGMVHIPLWDSWMRGTERECAEQTWEEFERDY